MKHTPILAIALMAVLSGCAAAPATLASQASLEPQTTSTAYSSDATPAPWPTAWTPDPDPTSTATPGEAETTIPGATATGEAGAPSGAKPSATTKAATKAATTAKAPATTRAATQAPATTAPARKSSISLVSCVYDPATDKTQGTWSYYGATASSAYTATVSGHTYAPVTIGVGPGTAYAKGLGKGSCSATITN